MTTAKNLTTPAPGPGAAPTGSRTRALWIAALFVMLGVLGFEFNLAKSIRIVKHRSWKLVESFAGRTPGQAGQFQGAVQTVVDGRGRLLLVDPDQAKVIAWQVPEGKLLFELSASAAQDANFQPRDVAAGPDGSVYVLDQPQGQMFVFGADGRLLRKWPAPAARGLAVEPNGRVLVSEQTGMTVVRYDAYGRKLGSFGGRGSGRGQLQDPFRLTVTASGEIGVLDMGNRRIAVFAADGSWVRAIGLKFDPVAVTTVQARGDLLYVNDFMGGAIYVYQRNGWLAEKIPLGGPSVLALDSAGDIYSAGPQGMGRYRAVVE